MLLPPGINIDDSVPRLSNRSCCGIMSIDLHISDVLACLITAWMSHPRSTPCHTVWETQVLVQCTRTSTHQLSYFWQDIRQLTDMKNTIIILQNNSVRCWNLRANKAHAENITFATIRHGAASVFCILRHLEQYRLSCAPFAIRFNTQ